MKNKELIWTFKISSLDLQYVLDHSLGEWTDAIVANSRIKNYGGKITTKEIRDASIKALDQDLHKLFLKNIDPIVQKYALANNIKINNLEGYHLVKYEVGQFFKEHTDQTEEFPRKISAVFYLNDNYDGGTITFPKLDVSFKPEERTLFVFPSTEEFSHSADPIVSGTKYVIVGFWV